VFLLTKQVAGCTAETLRCYDGWLRRFTAGVPEATALAVRTFFVGLQHLSASRQHQAYRMLRTFFRWCVETGVLADTPLRGFAMRTPKTLPDVPTEDEVRAVLAVCPETLEGVRNRTLLLVLADSGLRANEVLRLLVEDWRPVDPGVFVRAGFKLSVRFLEVVARFSGHDRLSGSSASWDRLRRPVQAGTTGVLASES